MSSSKSRNKARIYLLQTQGYKCFYCGCELSLTSSTLDHLVPLSKGGKRTDKNNLVASCGRCNNLLADYTSLEDVIEKLTAILNIKKKEIELRGLKILK